MVQIAIVLVLIAGMMLTVSVLRKWKHPKQKEVLLWSVFVIYALGNLYFTLLSRKQSPIAYLDILPFRNFARLFMSPEETTETVTGIAVFFLKDMIPIEGILLNILLYFPLGYLLPVLFPNLKTWHIILIGCLCSIATEAAQYIFKLGWCETDDVIHNTLGTALGVCLWRRQIPFIGNNYDK